MTATILERPTTTPTAEGRCGSCRHWTINHGEDGWGVCVLADEDYGDRSLARARGHAWSGELETNRDFGCVQWEAQ